MIFGFGPLLLAERGWSIPIASSITSIVLWLAFILHVARRPCRRSLRAPYHHYTPRIGRICHHARRGSANGGRCRRVRRAGVGHRPSRRRDHEPARAGVDACDAGRRHGPVLYALLLLPRDAPWVGGWLAEWAGSARVTFDLGAAMLVASCAALWLFKFWPTKPAAHARFRWRQSLRRREDNCKDGKVATQIHAKERAMNTVRQLASFD